MNECLILGLILLNIVSYMFLFMKYNANTVEPIIQPDISKHQNLIEIAREQQTVDQQSRKIVVDELLTKLDDIMMEAAKSGNTCVDFYDYKYSHIPLHYDDLDQYFINECHKKGYYAWEDCAEEAGPWLFVSIHKPVSRGWFF